MANLQVGQALTAADVPLPEGASLLMDPGLMIVHCIVPMEAAEEAGTPGVAEPEVIGRKAESEEEEG